MEELLAYRVELLSALQNVVIKFSELVPNLPSSTWQRPIKPGFHTPHYLLFNLCELEAQFFSPQLPRILAEENPILPAFDDETWMASQYHPDELVLPIMDKLADLRNKELGWLYNVPSTGWSRLARHPWWGVHTLQWWVELQLDYSYQRLREFTSIV